MFGLVFTEGALGVASAGQSASAASPLLVGHVSFGALVEGFTVWVLLVAIRHGRGPAVAATVFTSVAIFSTATTGAIFLVTGFANGMNVDRALALTSLGGTVLMMVFGAPRR